MNKLVASLVAATILMATPAFAATHTHNASSVTSGVSHKHHKKHHMSPTSAKKHGMMGKSKMMKSKHATHKGSK